MHERIGMLRALEPRQAGRNSYDAILEAATGLFSQFPAVDVSLRDIIGTAGVANQTLYNYFPAGRDDVALVLKDRFDLEILRAFEELVDQARWGEGSGNARASALLGACLAAAVFDRLRRDPFYATSLHAYLEVHDLMAIGGDRQDLREAVFRGAQARSPGWFSREELSRVADLCVHLTLQVVKLSFRRPDYPLDRLESNTRLLVRSLLQTAVVDWQSDSGGTLVRRKPNDPSMGPLPRISDQKRDSILSRILKRKNRS